MQLELFGDEDFRQAFGEDLSAMLDLELWAGGFDIKSAMARFRQEIASAVEKEGRMRTVIRSEILPLLSSPKRPRNPGSAGVYKASPEELTETCEKLLFAGHVEAVNSTAVSHDSLPIGITQIGVAMVGYGGNSGTFSQRLYRKEMSSRSEASLQEVLALIDRRHNGFKGEAEDYFSRLARRCIKTYAERALLVDKAEAEWRLGHGNPCAHELLSGAGYMSLLEASLGVLRRLIRDYKKFVFVSSAMEERGWLTMGHALNAGEYAILETLERHGERIVDRWRYGPESRVKALTFVKECCPEVLVGLFRASERSPPRLFYAHREHVHVAARIALADSMFRPERGFPMLLEVAGNACRSAFGAEGFQGLVQDAYAQAGANLEYFSEREKRW
jgi:hypothetical protein